MSKHRIRILADQVKSLIEEDIKMLCEWKNCELQEISVKVDYIHLVVSVLPKVLISDLMGTLNGKIAIK